MNKQNWAVIANPKSGKGKAVLAGKLLVDTIKNNAENDQYRPQNTKNRVIFEN